MEKELSNRRTLSLQNTIIVSTCLLTFIVSVVFSLINISTAYMIEDNFFKELLFDEKKHLQLQLAKAQKGEIELDSITPRKSYMRLYDTKDEFPQDLLNAYQSMPKKREYSGEEGRHYHLTYFKLANKILVAEVSDSLIVRPIRSNIFTWLVVLSLLMVIIALWLSYVVAKKSTAPLTQLANLLSNTSPDALPSQFSQHYPANEIGLLANKLEQAMARIKQFIHREQHFTRDSSHELRTPVTIIKNALELIEQKSLNRGEQALIERIRLANIQMEQTITTLLSLARESSEQKSKTPVLLLPCIERAVIEHSALLDNKAVELEIEVNSKTQVNCSATVLQILLNNVLSNAFQYTEQGFIRVTFSNQTLTISDTGGGIDDDIASNVLDNLVKGKKSQGFGIGLSLVKRLCEMNNLSLALTSTPSGVRISIHFE